jgi:hypothetical protein
MFRSALSRFSCVLLIALALALPLRVRAGGAEVSEAAATAPPRSREPDRFTDPVSLQGQQARGLYFNGPMMKRLGVKGIIRTVKGASLDAVVLDIKDGEGRVTYDTKIEAIVPQKRVFVKDFAAFVAELKAAGIYTIARVVCFSDPNLPRSDHSRAVLDNRPSRAGRIWADTGHRNTWLDPYNERNHELIADIARDVESFGFDEIQLDYVRFPVDEATVFAHFPAQVDKPRREVILSMLRRVDAAISIPINTDVFGLTALRVGDPAGLGQSLEDWVPHVEVFSPMLYVNGMKTWVSGGANRAERLVLAAMSKLRERVGHGPVLRPFLQAFANGADYYTPAFIAEQIRGARNAGSDGFLFWHPGSNYGLVQAGAAGAARSLMPFPLGERQAWREQAWRDGLPWGQRAQFEAEVAAAKQRQQSARDAPPKTVDSSNAKR